MAPEAKQYWRVVRDHFLISVAGGTLIALFLGHERAMSFGLGSALVAANWALLGWKWGGLLGKKPIALASSVIVIKYPLLALILYFAARQGWFLVPWFGGGILTVIPAGFRMARLNQQTEE